MKKPLVNVACGAVLASCIQSAMATEALDDADAAALALGDAALRPNQPSESDPAAAQAQPAAAQSDAASPRSWKVYIEDALRESGNRDAPSSLRNQASVDVIVQKELAPPIALKLSGRFDRYDPVSSSAPSTHSETTIREAYATWNISPVSSIDAGRVDERLGAAYGYNPTDFFKAGSVSADVSADPESRKTNRLGTVGVRAQHLWDGGSLQVLASPRLESYSEPGNPQASSDLQRTNGANRVLVKATQRLTENLQPQLLFLAEQGQSPQVGVNLSALATRSVTAYAEWTAGRSASLIGKATGQDDSAFRTRSAVGASWTTPLDLTFVAELQHNGAGATPAQLRSLQATNPAGWGAATQTASFAQELPTRYGGFLMATWRNAGMRRLDVSAYVQADQGGGRQIWAEARHHFDRADIALQLQKQSGPCWDRYGANHESRSVQVLAQVFV
jgi:hypothetical protein